ncbi:MAG: hypothetical protein JWM68_2089 [Verrucomicrobiales bacterium]|nr:hypothetical protein [Verrucomicrobiales bacterium]
MNSANVDSDATELFEKLLRRVEKKPIILMRFQPGFDAALDESRQGFERFTMAKSHWEFKDFKLPTLCIAEIPTEQPEGADSKFFVGIVSAKASVATFDSRITVIKLRPITLPSWDALSVILPSEVFQNLFNDRLNFDFSQVLSPKLSVEVVKALAKSDRKTIEIVASSLPDLRKVSPVKWEQSDAIKTAMAAFGLSTGNSADMVDIAADSDSGLSEFTAHVLEDNVIHADATIVPHFELIEKHVTGKAIFSRNAEQLVIYTANKGPLEEMLGVDLIYVNETLGNTVMVQYKMLSHYADPMGETSDWIFRPDGQLDEEISRMKLPQFAGSTEDYRLHKDPFFFKFVKRKGDGHSHQSFVISLDHLNKLLRSPAAKGPKGGIRVSYQALKGGYLRDSDLIGLIRSGYIGTHRAETEALHAIISEVSKGNRALVLAWQKLRSDGKAQTDFDDGV